MRSNAIALFFLHKAAGFVHRLCVKVMSLLNLAFTMSKSKTSILFYLPLLCFGLSACTSLSELGKKHNPEESIRVTRIAAQWQASLPHEGKIADLQQFWQQYQDVLLLELIAAAQTESATLATAKARIAQARSKRIQANAALLPGVDGSASASRSLQQPAIRIGDMGAQQGGSASQTGNNTYNNAQIGAQTSWELDLFGANKTKRDAAKTLENAAHAGWHEARVSVAAELANTYFNQRFCALQLELLQMDAKSRAESARLADVAVTAGFSAKASRDLAQASVADAAQQLKTQQAQCDSEIKALVALTDFDEATLRKKLEMQAFNPNSDVSNNVFALDKIPAQIIAQRPDIYTAEADLVSAASEVKSTYVQGLPKVSLNGSIGWMWLSGLGFSTNGKTWSLGPVSITFPIYHGGVQAAGLASAEANYEASAANYRSKVRQAVKEVEDALVNLHSANTRQSDILAAIQSYQAAFTATETKVKAGFANRIELEEQRRSLLTSKTTAINNLKQRTLAWVSLYRAVGGGWQRMDASSEESNKMESNQ